MKPREGAGIGVGGIIVGFIVFLVGLISLPLVPGEPARWYSVVAFILAAALFIGGFIMILAYWFCSDCNRHIPSSLLYTECCPRCGKSIDLPRFKKASQEQQAGKQHEKEEFQESGEHIEKGKQEEKVVEDNCIFCKIANGEIPSSTLYEDEDFRVILDISPASRGHGLIIPKEHYKDLYELDDRLAAKILAVAKKVVNSMRESLKCQGYNIVQNNQEAAGQTVFHYHMHLIPRYSGDKVNISWPHGKLTDEDAKELLSIEIL